MIKFDIAHRLSSVPSIPSFYKFGIFLDKRFEILFQNKIFRVLNGQTLVFFVRSIVTDA